MCSYCGCDAITVIGRLMADHSEIVTAVGALRRAVTADDAAAAGRRAEALASLVHTHTDAEERGLFTELRRDPGFATHIESLCHEHEEIGAGLDRIRAGDLAGIADLEHLLRRHIDREDNGIFPAAAVGLDGPAWERVVRDTADADADADAGAPRTVHA
jgi:hemerythrin-like domain-containing protein